MNLNIFNTSGLFDASTNLFQQLGIKLNSNTAEALPTKDLLKSFFKDNEVFNSIKSTYFIGIIDDSVFQATGMFDVNYSIKEALQQGDKNYDGLMLFALELTKKPTRTEISEITRVFNRISQKMPVALVLKYTIENEAVISIALSERFKYLQNWRQGEKAGKVIILRDIHTKPENTHAGHQRILLDLVKPTGVTNYAQLHAQWLEVLDVNILNKKFYQEIFNWYLWALKEVRFPQIRPEADLVNDDVHQSESLIRLLTRLMFCWFMKEKGLINEHLFDEAYAGNILNSLKRDETTYYKAILQNLFFATLNKPIPERKIIDDGWNKKEYGDPLVYRYKELFKEPEKLLLHFENIPFLNGGLFDCLDSKKTKDTATEIRLDGFSTKKDKQPLVPNKLFFGEYENVDLSEEYDDNRKNHLKVTGLLDIFASYKFTIEESTPLEEEIALDPELLGKVFENLLASYNPETKTTARKQTGSFYTPREIVNYMVDESILEYLKGKLTDGKEHETELRQLIGYETQETKFTDTQKLQLIKAINEIRVLDPACGSGAFPMGVLQRLIHMLKKLDPENKIWLEMVIANFPDYLQNEMRQKLTVENWDYVRKLGIIQECIYGIDIQPIAIQISKLRFFISLLVDQKEKPGKPNRGFDPLPNLDFKLVAANTLIGAPQTDTISSGLFAGTLDEFEQEFKKLTGKYFSTYKPDEKKKLKATIEKLIDAKVDEKVRQIESRTDNANEKIKQALKEKHKKLNEQQENEIKLWKSFANIFKNESVGFFETKYFFPQIKDGFDVVIGNPPYVNVENLESTIKKYLFEHYQTCKGRTDIYIAFIETAMKLIKQNGVFSYIIPYPFTNQNYGSLARKMLIENYFVREILDTSGYYVFETAVVKNVILSVVKCKNKETTSIKIAKSETVFSDNSFIVYNLNQNLFLELKDYRFETKDISQSLKLKTKIWENSIRLDEICLISYGARLNHKTENIGKENYIHQNFKKGFKPFTEGKNIDRYSFTQLGWLNYRPEIHYNSMFPELFENDKIFFINVVKDRLRFAFDKDKFYNSHTVINCLKWDLLKNATHITVRRNLTKDKLTKASKYNYLFLLGILNSNIINWYFLKFLSESLHFYPDDAKELPIPNIDLSKQKPYITLVDQILTAKKNNPKADTSALEKQIDDLVYKLYDLTEEEIAIIENSNNKN